MREKENAAGEQPDGQEMSVSGDATADDSIPGIDARPPDGKWPELQPLEAATTDAEPFPVGSLGEPLAGAVNAITETVQAPTGLVAASVLGAAALATQGLVDVKTLGGSRPCSLFLLTIAESGERKSTVDRYALAPVEEAESRLFTESKAAFEAYENKHEAWKAARQKTKQRGGKNRSKDDIENDLREIGPEPTRPAGSTLTVAEPTFEALQLELRLGRGTLGIFSDEGGQFLGGYGMNEDNRMKTIAGLSKLWDGRPPRRTRATSESFALRGKRLSVHLMAQPIAATGFLTDPLSKEQGFLARFLVSWPASRIGHRTIDGRCPDNDSRYIKYTKALADILRRPLPVEPKTTNDLRPATLALDNNAHDVLIQFAQHIEDKQGDECELAGLRGFASKVAEHAARIAGVLAVVGNLDAREIDAETMKRGCAIASWFLAERLRIDRAATDNASIERAKVLHQWIAERGKDFVTTREIQQYGPRPYGLRESPDARRDALKRLEAAGHIRRREHVEINGKTVREAWEVRPT